ncbi:MAG: uroporphyrinogen decarboxylase family protein [Phycisphaerae bacterium]
MTNRERIYRLVRGKPIDRVPFAQYRNAAAPDEEIWSVIGRANMGIIPWCPVHKLTFSRCTFGEETFERNGRQGLRYFVHTPEGTMVEERLVEPAYGSSRAVKHYVAEVADYRILLAYLRDITVVRNPEDPLAKCLRELGDDGAPMVSLLRTPYQQLWVQWVCLEDLCLHLVDEPGLTEEVVAELARVLRDVMKVAVEVAAESDVPYFNFPDNITAPVIGEKYFRKYCLPYYVEMAGMLAERGLDVPIAVHMDGHLKPLWKAISESPVRVIDSLSPPPDNDTSVADALRLRGDVRLGVNFPSSVHLASPETIYGKAMEMLQQGGRTGRLMIQVSENVPKDVWRTSYPQIVKAIGDFGEL